MNRLTTHETRLLSLINRAGGQYCPDDAAKAEPVMMDHLRSLTRKGRLRIDDDCDEPSFMITALGRQELRAA